MKELHEPLDDSEIEYLERFLLDRIDEDADTDGKDEGVLDISELDGLFTAIVSGPVTIAPSRWLPSVWGDFPPMWSSEEAFSKTFSMLVRHMNGIAATLNEQPERFEPMFGERTVKGKIYTIVDEWCEGYSRGIALAADAWKAGGEEMAALLAPILGFTSETHWRAHELASDEEVDNMQRAITPNVRQIHAYWAKRRVVSEVRAAASSAYRTQPRAGRNDPCPCGSGKKYKKCCLH